LCFQNKSYSLNPYTAAYLRVGNTLAGLKASNKYLAGPKGQHKYSSWPKGPAKDLYQPEAAHDFVVARGHNFLRYPKINNTSYEVSLAVWLHTYGFSPVWVLMWVISRLFFKKELLHWLHLYGFSPAWAFLWLLKSTSM